MLNSVICRSEHFDTEWYKYWFNRIKLPIHSKASKVRKQWEWVSITQALFERYRLMPGMRGLGLAVGTEPLASFFASLGCVVDATDLVSEKNEAVWNNFNQIATSKEALFKSELIDRDSFERNVTFFSLDMNCIDTLEKNSYDFIWSSCSVEHAGTLELSKDVVIKSADLLKPGGVFVHATEYNVSSTTKTLESGNTVIYRRSDLEDVDHALRRKECRLERLDLDPGSRADDVQFDFEPYLQHGRNHIKLLLGGYVTTSVLLIGRKY